ncbi:hypothetical protein, partial [Mycetocola saprophilus]|uniref:hypothetical protein n=1 Tax=Mycetocola saprophilus TaxID=76636 RepID=UPI0004BEDA3F
MSGAESVSVGLARLREPFLPNEINTLPKPFSKDSKKANCPQCGGYHGMPAAHLDYVGHAALTNRLLEADPQWTWTPLALGPDGLPKFDSTGGLWIKLTICGVTRLGYGDAQGKSGANAIKEAIGDALRNAGMRFGAALDLWHKGDPLEVTTDEDAPIAEPIVWTDLIAAATTVPQLTEIYNRANTVNQLTDPVMLALKARKAEVLAEAPQDVSGDADVPPAE